MAVAPVPWDAVKSGRYLVHNGRRFRLNPGDSAGGGNYEAKLYTVLAAAPLTLDLYWVFGVGQQRKSYVHLFSMTFLCFGQTTPASQ